MNHPDPSTLSLSVLFHRLGAVASQSAWLANLQLGHSGQQGKALALRLNYRLSVNTKTCSPGGPLGLLLSSQIASIYLAGSGGGNGVEESDAH